jgi:uncharacterized protein (TIGR02452 family)
MALTLRGQLLVVVHRKYDRLRMTWFQAFVALDLQQYRSLAKIATENCEIYTSGAYTNPNGDVIALRDLDTAAEQSGITYDPTHTFLNPGPGSLPLNIEVTGETTVGALHRLIQLEREPNSVALNFANPVEAGGGFLGGAQAQEEAICRCSTLYNLLLTQPRMYEEAKKNHFLYTDFMSLIKDVPIIRDDAYVFLEHPFVASFITCAAPVAFEFRRVCKDPQLLYQTLENRIRKIVLCAIDGGFRNIVLGAFGCGAFGNRPEDVAAMFQTVLIKEGLGAHFGKIVFAIYSGKSDRKQAIFRKALLPGPEPDL